MVYKAKRVLPIDAPVIVDGEVMVREGEIEAVGRGLSISYPREAVRDLGNCVLMPGFVNVHSHIDYTFARNRVDGLNLWDWIERVTFNKNRPPSPDTVLASATLGAAENALSGVTCMGDSSYTGMAASALENVGLRGIVYLEVFGQSAGSNYDELFARKMDDMAALRLRCSGRVSVGMSPHSIYTSNPGLLQLCAESCAEQGVQVAMHLAETAAEVDYSLSGKGPLANWRRKLGYEPMVSGLSPAMYLQDIGLLRSGVCLAHCVHLSEEDVVAIGGSGASVAHCPRSNAYLGCGIAPILALADAGATVGLGTDSAGSCMRLDFFEEMRFALAFHRAAAQEASVVTAKRVLEWATIGGAKALGLDSRVGSLTPGKRADMIAVDIGDALPGEELELAVVSRHPKDVVMTMVDGAEIVSGGKLARLDIEECSARLAESMVRLGIG